MRTNLSYPVALNFSGRSLKDLDIGSKSDPICIVYLKDNDWFEKGRTEVVNDNLNPDWIENIVIDYHFETEQRIKILVADFDGHSMEKIGSVKTTLAELASKPTTIHELKKKKKKQGTVIVKSEEAKGMNSNAILQFEGKNLADKDFVSKSDPFFRMYRVRPNNELLKIYESEVIEDNLNPKWRTFELSVQDLCNGDYEAPIKIEVFDYDTTSANDFIGHAMTTMNQIASQEPLKLMDKNKETGTIHIKHVVIQRIYSFLDYLRGGTQISMITAIDFTGSNGRVTEPSSLHYLNPNAPNQYEQAIMGVGSVLEYYDADKLFPLFGFGGMWGGDHYVRHCFAVNRNESNPQVLGTQGILECYRNSLSQISLSGPTLFSEVIERAISIAEQSPPGFNYYVLFILTDGAITDMEKTVNLLVRAAHFPLSVVIVGVGNADFGNMNILDGDGEALRDSNGHKAIRDIVQFVPFAKYRHSPEQLTRQVLAEIPKQVEQFMKTIGFTPNIPPN